MAEVERRGEYRADDHGRAAPRRARGVVCDLGEGAQFNLPNGDDVHFIFDEVTSASSGMIKIYGDQMVGIGVVAPKAFTKVQK